MPGPLNKIIKTIKQHISEYFSETSIHGLRYLVDGKNILEKVCWSLVVMVSLYFAGSMIIKSIEDNEKAPILTTIETISFEDVPFPAVTIAADERANPWGFVQKTFNMMEFYEPADQKYEEGFNELQEQTNFILEAIIEKIDVGIVKNWNDKTVTWYKDKLGNRVDKGSAMYFDYEEDIMQFVPTLAGIYLGNETIRDNDQIKEDIKRKMIEVFFKNTYEDLSDFYNYEVKKIIEDYRYIKTVDDSNNNNQDCDEEFEDCENMNTNQDCDEEFEDCDNINTNNQDCDEEFEDCDNINTNNQDCDEEFEDCDNPGMSQDPQYTQEISICENDLESGNENGVCTEYLKQSFRALFLPTEIIRDEYKNLEFGTYLAYFSRLLSLKGFFEDSSPSELTSEEQKVRALMASSLKSLTNGNSGRMSIFEMVKVLHKNFGETGYGIGPIVYGSGCAPLPMYYLEEAWKSYIDHSSVETNNDQFSQQLIPCVETMINVVNYSTCCQLSKSFKNELAIVLKIMKYSIQPAVFYEPLEEFLKSYDNLDFLPFKSLINSTDILDRNLMEYNPNPRVLMCQYAKHKPFLRISGPNNCQLIHTSITNGGIGYTFNSANFWDMFVKTNYTRTFAKIMRPKGFGKEPYPDEFDDEEDFKLWTNRKMDIEYPSSIGPSYGLQVFLEGHRLRVYDNVNGGYKENLPLKVTVHDPMSIGDATGTSVDINVGYVSTFLIKPSQIVTSETTKEMEKEKRKCRFHDENNLMLFKDYSQANCKFECQLKAAYEKCHCVPWDYPHLNDSMAICDGYVREIFKEIMVNPETKEACQFCENDCTTTSYSYSVYATKIDANHLCKPKPDDDPQETISNFGKALLYGTVEDNDYEMPPRFIRHFEEIVNGKSNNEMDLCIERVNHLAIVNFQIDTQTVTQIQRTERVTFANTLSNIGGTLGLFSGISIISMIELLYWIYRLMINCFRTSIKAEPKNSILG